MFSIGRLCKRRAFFLRFHYFENNAIANQSPHLEQQLHYSLPVRFLSTCQNRNRCEEKDQSLKIVVSYLVNSCGLSPDSAISASKFIRRVNPKKSDAVIHLLKTHGFSQNQISAMIRRSPRLLSSNPEKSLLPKLNYLYSVGASGPDAVRIFSNGAWIFRSLEKHIIPAFDVLRALLGTDTKAIAIIARSVKLLNVDLERNFIPNINTLRDERVPESRIWYWLQFRPSDLVRDPRCFNKTMEKVKAFGFSPSSSTFVIAVGIISSMSKSTWEKKLGIFQRWGWSEDLIHEAFRKFPFCLALSGEKINAGMHFFINKAGVEASYIARYPQVLAFSLEKRVIPRYSINQILLSRGLVRIPNFSLGSLLMISNQSFKERFVVPYLKEVPELLDLFMAKTN